MLFVACVMDGNESDYRASLDVQAEVPLKTPCNEEREARNRANRERHRERQQEYRLREEERRSIACNWDITEDEFFKKRNEIKEDVRCRRNYSRWQNCVLAPQCSWRQVFPATEYVW